MLVVVWVCGVNRGWCSVADVGWLLDPIAVVSWVPHRAGTARSRRSGISSVAIWSKRTGRRSAQSSTERECPLFRPRVRRVRRRGPCEGDLVLVEIGRRRRPARSARRSHGMRSDGVQTSRWTRSGRHGRSSRPGSLGTSPGEQGFSPSPPGRRLGLRVPVRRGSAPTAFVARWLGGSRRFSARLGARRQPRRS